MNMTIRRLAFAAAVFFPAAFPAFAGAGQDPQKPQIEKQTIRLQVEMVTLPVVVSTPEGKRILDLNQEDFRVFEDGVEQEIAGFSATDEPVSLVLALDTSGSTEVQLPRIQNEAIHFVNSLHPDDSVAIMSFSQDVNLLEEWSIDRDRNAYGIKESRPGGWTVLYEAVWLAIEELLKPVQERKALLLFTDGVDTASRKVSRKETIELAKETRATLYAIYFNTEFDTQGGGGILGRPTAGGLPIPGVPPIVTTGPSIGRGASPGEYAEGRRYLSELADYSGGRVVDALEMRDLGPAFEEIARELASQYSIGYYSTNSARDGKFRRVEVKVKKPGLVARTKKGYYGAKPEKKGR
jgi:Ca-activated chloride channel family protein